MNLEKVTNRMLLLCIGAIALCIISAFVMFDAITNGNTAGAAGAGIVCVLSGNAAVTTALGLFLLTEIEDLRGKEEE